MDYRQTMVGGIEHSFMASHTAPTSHVWVSSTGHGLAIGDRHRQHTSSE
jgi:hypothetical protein